MPATSLSVFPDNLTWDEGAAIWSQFMTAWGGLLHFGRLTAGEVVLVTAASSSTGVAALSMAKCAGATSIAVTRTSAKREQLLKAGADHVVVLEDEDLIKRVREITGGKGANVLYDPVGGENLAIMVSAAAVGARVIEYGLLSKEPTVLPLFEALQKYVSVKAYDVHEVFFDHALFQEGRNYLFKHFEAGTLPFHFGPSFELSQVVEAHREMEKNSHVGKIIIRA